MKTILLNTAGALALVASPFVIFYGSDLLNSIIDLITNA